MLRNRVISRTLGSIKTKAIPSTRRSMYTETPSTTSGRLLSKLLIASTTGIIAKSVYDVAGPVKSSLIEPENTKAKPASISAEQSNKLLFIDNPSPKEMLNRLTKLFDNDYENGLKAIGSLSANQVREIAKDLNSLELLLGMKHSHIWYDEDEFGDESVTYYSIPPEVRSNLLKSIGIDHILKLIKNAPRLEDREKLASFLDESGFDLKMKSNELLKLAKLVYLEKQDNNADKEEQVSARVLSR